MDDSMAVWAHRAEISDWIEPVNPPCMSNRRDVMYLNVASGGFAVFSFKDESTRYARRAGDMPLGLSDSARKR